MNAGIQTTTPLQWSCRKASLHRLTFLHTLAERHFLPPPALNSTETHPEGKRVGGKVEVVSFFTLVSQKNVGKFHVEKFLFLIKSPKMFGLFVATNVLNGRSHPLALGVVANT